jgi:hypothetical protein
LETLIVSPKEQTTSFYQRENWLFTKDTTRVITNGTIDVDMGYDYCLALPARLLSPAESPIIGHNQQVPGSLP